MIWILVVILLLFAVGALPHWGYASYGYGPPGIIALIVIVLVVLILAGRI
jgi:Sec-independent protein translocase protein TatA